MDCSGKMLARLKKNLADYSDRVQVVSADFFDHDFGFEFYDGATATMALHYYSEAQKLQLYKNLRVGIKKDGFFLLTDKFAPTQNYQDFCRSEFERKRTEARQPEGHYYTFTPLTVANEAALLFKAGFAEVQVCWGEIEHGGSARDAVSARRIAEKILRYGNHYRDHIGGKRRCSGGRSAVRLSFGVSPCRITSEKRKRGGRPYRLDRPLFLCYNHFVSKATILGRVFMTLFKHSTYS